MSMQFSSLTLFLLGRFSFQCNITFHYHCISQDLDANVN